jgi:hypothetical protein
MWLYKGFQKYTSMQGVTFGITYKPLNSLSISLYPNYYFGYNELQYVTDLEYQKQAKYVLARIDQESLGVSVRIDYALTSDITLQFYGQPFLFAGKYSEYKRVGDSRASGYNNRFTEFVEGKDIKLNQESNEWEVDENLDGTIDYSFSNDNFNFLQFRSNLVFRWEYRPGSSLYLVWSQGRTESDSYGDFALKRGMDNLFAKHPQDIFLVKVSYMLVF